MKRFIILLVLLTTITYRGTAQTFNVKGIVFDKETKAPLEGAIIHENNSNNFVITNNDGTFEINVSSKNTEIIITHLSYKSQNIAINGQSNLNILLAPTSIETDVVIVKRTPLETISNSIIITDEIKNGSQIRNTAELFNDILGFSLQKRSATAIEPSFRGFKYEEMNMKYDGQAKIVQACPNRMDPMTAHVIPEEISKIEVIKGPYTVRYGQRFGPTVNMVTKTPTPDSYGFHGTAEAGYETNGTNLMGRAELKYAQKKYDITINGETRNFGDYVDGEGTVVPSSFKTNSYSIKLGLNPTTKQRINVNWRQKFGSDIKHAGLPMDSPKDDSWLLMADYKLVNISKKVRSFTLKTYTSYVDHVMNNFDRPNFMKMEMETPVQSQTYGGRTEFILVPNKKMLVFAGLDADVIARQGFKTMIKKTNMMGEPLTTPIVMATNVWQGAIIQDYGMFLESSYKINKVLTTTAGIRSDYVYSQLTDPDQNFAVIYGGSIDNKTNITVGGNYTLKYSKKGWLAELAYGRGVRTPSMVERYINNFTIGNDMRSYFGNPDLKPEINNQFELSTAKKYKTFSFGGSVYFSKFTNYITAVINPNIVVMGSTVTPRQFTNVNANQYGFEVFIKYNFYKHFTLSSDVSYTIAYNETLKEPLAQVAPLKTNFSLKWQPKKYWIDVRGSYTMSQNRYATSFGETETPGYFLLNLRAGVKINKYFTIGAAALNIFNKTYYNHLNFSYKNSNINQGRIFEPGRSFSFFAKFKF